jgi:hypothetical protein
MLILQNWQVTEFTETKCLPLQVRICLRSVVIVQQAGGFGRSGNSKLAEPRIYLRTYGVSIDASNQLHRACQRAFEKLKRQTYETVIIYRAIKEVDTSYTRDPVTNWPYHFSVWRLATNYNEV